MSDCARPSGRAHSKWISRQRFLPSTYDGCAVDLPSKNLHRLRFAIYTVEHPVVEASTATVLALVDWRDSSLPSATLVATQHMHAQAPSTTSRDKPTNTSSTARNAVIAAPTRKETQRTLDVRRTRELDTDRILSSPARLHFAAHGHDGDGRAMG
jgi:hypothetical protein